LRGAPGSAAGPADIGISLDRPENLLLSPVSADGNGVQLSPFLDDRPHVALRRADTLKHDQRGACNQDRLAHEDDASARTA
jgi:hypothetical protein